ncbi:hypothetical protein [Pseudalkalibacillus hwajinpoensis]|uniref:Uncharacterized protein n=1 Tax=Guptibacillus hwajinpoensis TaxID=208199 RepID=A0A4U1MGA7_9BACL|nr:hypothetical protein [Pseudalkalibacillus hwajinpoensis]TKD69781.1 hypothetical protein FBF83_10870 [Pseudalkalibacillus hwajinpoensis]
MDVAKKKKNKKIAGAILLVIVIVLSPFLHDHFNPLTLLITTIIVYAIVMFIVGLLSKEEKS